MPELTVVAPQTPLEGLVDDYLAACKAKGLARNTIEQSYGYPLRGILLPFCRRERITDARDLSGRVLNRLSAELQNKGGARGRPLSRHSIHAYSRAVNHFLNWARQEGEEVAGKAQLPKLPRRLLVVLEREEIQRMEDAAKTERDKLIVRLLADTGIRVGELIGVVRSDLVLQGRDRYLKVRGKGDKERLVPIPRLYERLRRYLERGRPRDAGTERIFVGLKRRPGGDYGPLSESGVQQMVRTLASEAGLEKRVHPHLFRHSFITWQIKRGMNPVQLRLIVGHESTAMIDRVYSHLVPQDAYAAMLKTLLEEG